MSLFPIVTHSTYYESLVAASIMLIGFDTHKSVHCPKARAEITKLKASLTFKGVYPWKDLFTFDDSW